MAPATVVKGNHGAVDDELEDAVAEFADEPTDGEDSADSDGETKVTRGRIKRDSIEAYEAELQRRFQIALGKYDEKLNEKRQAWIDEQQEGIRNKLDQELLKTDPSKVQNPEAVAQSIQRQIQKQQDAIAELQNRMQALLSGGVSPNGAAE